MEMQEAVTFWPKGTQSAPVRGVSGGEQAAHDKWTRMGSPAIDLLCYATYAFVVHGLLPPIKRSVTRPRLGLRSDGMHTRQLCACVHASAIGG